MKTCDDCFQVARYWKRGSGEIHQCNLTGLVISSDKTACALFIARDVPDPDPVDIIYPCPPLERVT